MLDLSIPNCMNNPLEISETFDANISQGILGYFDTNSEFDFVAISYKLGCSTIQIQSN